MTLLISGNDMTQITMQSDNPRQCGRHRCRPHDDTVINVDVTITNNTGTPGAAASACRTDWSTLAIGRASPMNDVRINVTGNNSRMYCQHDSVFRSRRHIIFNEYDAARRRMRATQARRYGRQRQRDRSAVDAPTRSVDNRHRASSRRLFATAAGAAAGGRSGRGTKPSLRRTATPPADTTRP